jgi:IPT/TIG domain
MRALLVIVAAASVAVIPTSAEAAPRAHAAATKPTITRVSPMRVKVGRTITVRGKHFSRRRTRDKVLFRAKNGRSAIASVKRASGSKLVLKVPAAAEQILTKKSSKGVPTRIYLRVVTNRYGKLSSLRHSPVVVSSLKSVDPCSKKTDYDGDLLPNSVELKYGLNPCKADTDGDGLSDGWEYWSAKDLNVKAVPYPGKKPFPNPLDKSDSNYDFDGDSLTASVEYKLWKISGSSFNPALANNGQRDSALGYSDGTQTSRPSETPAVPAFKTAGLGARYPAQDMMRNDGLWSDDERDADADGLNNYVEAAGPGRFSWWVSYFASVEPTPDWPKSYYGPFRQRPFADVEAADPDVDGDSLLDGEDDQDNDDINNIDEMYLPTAAYSNGYRKNAFNPCAPDQSSRTCPPYAPF